MISVVLDVVGGLLLVLGLVLMTIALVGVLRMPGTYSKLHAQGLATGPGVCCVLASSVATENAATISYAAVGIVFTVLTAPVASHAIARAARRRGAPAEPR
jgi:multicomponent Na+:H+ antiporter subunit G